MIRTAWFYVALVASGIIHAIGVIGAKLLGVKQRRPGGIYDWGANDWSRDVLAAAGTPVEVEGLERVPPGAVVFASNHSSLFDMWALAARLPGSVRFVAKQELLRVPLLGWAMLASGHIIINRAVKRRAFAAYDQAAQAIRNGFSAVVFPEGTRSRTGEIQPFKNAPFALAIAAQVPIVPVYVHNTFEILPKGGFRLRPRPIRVRIGDPIPTAGLSPDDRQRLSDRTRSAILALKARVDAGGDGQ